MTVARKLPKWTLMLIIFNNYTSARLGICAPSDTRIHMRLDTLLRCHKEDKNDSTKVVELRDA